MTAEPGVAELVVNVLAIFGLLTLILCARFTQRKETDD